MKYKPSEHVLVGREGEFRAWCGDYEEASVAYVRNLGKVISYEEDMYIDDYYRFDILNELTS